MGSEDLYKKRVREKRIRKIDKLKMLPFRYLLICEGERTEPNYFKSIQKSINKKYAGTKIREILKIEIEGTGYNTMSLVNKAEEISKKDNIGFGQVWCVFDKDSFSNELFNGAINHAKNLGFHSSWSNEAFELWYLLHFEYLNSGITRHQYNDKLDKILKSKGIKEGYIKNLTNIYEILKTYGNEVEAIENAKKLLTNYNNNISDADKKPATTVYLLVEELNKLLDKDTNESSLKMGNY